jgi:Delta7-sterol 5-desaturase
MCQPPPHFQKNEKLAATVKKAEVKPVRANAKHSIDRSGWVDLAAFCAPALFFWATDVVPIFVTGGARFLSTHAFLSLHYMLVDKDNYNMKISQKQLNREKKDYLVGTVLHMWAQVALQLIFPSMFFGDSSKIGVFSWHAFLSHVLVVEPLYYFAHVWLHKPEIMKEMHSFHHMSVNTLPSTSLVQDFKEHFIYIATFGPAFLVPFAIHWECHWSVICAYLVLFDIINAWGHTHVQINSWIFESKWSPMRYLFYTPEFHLGHHKYYRANYALFMPFWDHLMGTYREYKVPEDVRRMLPAKQQDFVFIGHNGGLGHALSCPEVCPYNVYDEYRSTFLPIQVEFLIMAVVGFIGRLVVKNYKVSRYLIDDKFIGRVICILRTPIDFMNPKTYPVMNQEIVKLMEDQHRECGTRSFGLGNLTKMKQLNDGGSEIVRLVEENEYLKDKDIRVWTGDTMTTASVFHQVLSVPNLKKIFYIGGSGKIGKAVSMLLMEKGIQVKIYSRYMAMQHPNLSYTQDLSDMSEFEHIVIGKLLSPKVYQRAVDCIKKTKSHTKTKYLLDYTVPFLPLNLGENIHHIQIGVLNVAAKENSQFPVLRGHYDVCFGLSENQIYPCHAGCIINMLEQKKDNETGDVDGKEVLRLWKVARSYGLTNREPKIKLG